MRLSALLMIVFLILVVCVMSVKLGKKIDGYKQHELKVSTSVSADCRPQGSVTSGWHASPTLSDLLENQKLIEVNQPTDECTK